MRHSPEQVTKALAIVARSESRELAQSYLEQSGDYDTAMIVKSMQGTGDVTGAGVGVFNSFLPLIQRRSLLGQIQAVKGFYVVPENVRVLFGDSADAAFVREGAEIPILQSDLSTVVMTPKRISAIQIITQELVRSGAEHLLSKAIITSTAKAESQAFISTAAATPEAPAGAFYGVTPLSGTTSLVADFSSLVAAFDGDLSQSVLIVSPMTAIKMSSVWPNAGMNGSVGDLPIIANHAVPNDFMGIVEPQRILLIDSGVNFEISSDATIVTRDALDNTVTGSLHLFQENLQCARINKYVDWKPAADAVAVITGGTY